MSVNLPPFQALLQEHRADVYRFLVATAGPSDADDVFQETWIAALRAYPRLEHGDALDRWVLRIATRKVLDQHRRRAARPVPGGSPDEVAGDRPARGSRAAADLDDPLWVAVRLLPPRQRAAVVHRYVLDLPYERIAELIGGSADAARANVSQAMRTLRGEVMQR